LSATVPDGWEKREMKLTIKTNNHARELIPFADMPEKARKDFDYVVGDDEYTPRFFCYRGEWYDVDEFVRIVARKDYRGGFAYCADDDSALLRWDGIQTDTYFSGVVVRYVGDDADAIVCGTVTS
jgi:hypothetical protein